MCIRDRNWTDVSGFLIADPRIIDNPKPIKTITYRELRELSYICLLYTSCVYTRNEKGRELLLEGRVKALANREERCISHKKVKGALE